jgi:hypothetical protein
MSLLTLIGLGLLGISLFAPEAEPHRGTLFAAATQTSWAKPLDLPAAWASLRIMLASLGMVLVIESTGTFFSFLKLKTVALTIFFLQLLPCLGLLYGGFLLTKSLL